MMCLQYLFILFNLTAQPTVGIPAFTAEITHQYQLPLAACDTLSVTTKTGQNDLSRSAFHPSQAHLVITTEMVETALEILHPEQKTHTHERLGTLKNALRGPPPLAWGGTRIGSYVYGRYELDSSVAPKKLPSSPLPDSYMNPKHIVDMEPARSLPGSTLNAGGEVRNANYFWQELLERDPDMFSKGNIYRIEELGMSPKVDKVWLKQNPAHQSFLDDVLHHHHIDKGPIAVPLPETIHQQWTKALHGGVQ